MAKQAALPRRGERSSWETRVLLQEVLALSIRMERARAELLAQSERSQRLIAEGRARVAHTIGRAQRAAAAADRPPRRPRKA